jgi:hypothetical protein
MYFLINLSWVSGDVAYPNGWSSRFYSAEECKERAAITNARLERDPRVANRVKVICNVDKPDIT